MSRRFHREATIRPCPFCGGRYMPILGRRDHHPRCQLVTKASERQYRADDVRAHEDYGTRLLQEACPAHGFYPAHECPGCELTTDQRRGK